MKRTARCSHCYRPQAITRDGHLFKHTRGHGPNLSDLPRCPGSGQEVQR